MLNIYSKEGILFIVQVDHISGEIYGSLFDCFYNAGASNVQCFATTSKKNRPGNVFLIDAAPDKADVIENIIINELGSTGWHKIVTQHRHVPTETVKKDVDITAGSCKFSFSIEGKQIKGTPESIRPEHSCCVKLKEKLNDENINIPLKQIYIKVQTALYSEDKAEIVF